MRRMERQFQADMERALNALRLDMMRGIGDDADEMARRLNDDKVTRPFQDAIVRALQRVALAGSDFGREQVETFVFGVRKAAIEGAVWELANNAAAQWALGYGYELVRGLLDTTRARLQAEVSEYVRNSETIGQLTRRLMAGGIFSEERARMVAVTEVTRAFHAGSVAAWKASGVIEKKRFNVNADELVCPRCGPLNGQVVELDKPWVHPDGSEEEIPVHPRCRCWATPAID